MRIRAAVAFTLVLPSLVVEARSQCLSIEREHWLPATPRNSGQFATSVALSGNYAAVGASLEDGAAIDSGAVHVYERGPGGWALQQRLSPVALAAGDEFGISVALDGDVLVVGARSDDTQGSETGAAYVFVRGAGGWQQRLKLLASDATSSTRPFFGESVAISGDTIVIGANMVDHTCSPPGHECGQAYVFVAPPGGWAAAPDPLPEVRRLRSSSPLPDNAQLGGTVAIKNDVIVVGAIHDTSQASPNTGVAYVYVRPAGGWASGGPAPLGETTRLEPCLTNAPAQIDDLFGLGVSVDQGVIAVGAYRGQGASPSIQDTGAVYVFREPVGGWPPMTTMIACPTLVPDSLRAFDGFGHRLEVDGNRLIAAASLHELPGATQAGQVYVYDYDGLTMTWDESRWLRASDAAATDTFGFGLALEGDTAIVGAIVDDHSGMTDAGSVYVFDLAHCPVDLFCSGDGLDPAVTTACPCGNPGASRHGCAWSNGPAGAQLLANGEPNPDTMQLLAGGMPAMPPSIFLKGDAVIPEGVDFGDGLRCAAGHLVRLGLKQNVNGASRFPESGDPLLSVRGMTPPGSGLIAYYQVYYRNAAAYCTAATFNSTNGVRITW